jgi:hypothetical protein
MKWLLFFVSFICLACNNGETVTPTKSTDSSIKSIDPNQTIRDTSQYPIDSSGKDSGTTGVTH